MTRLLLKLVATENSSYEMDYYRDVQGLIYNLLRGSEFNCHDKKGYKFFSFSQIFPFHSLHEGDRRNLIIASPNADFVSYIKEQLEYLQRIRIGAMQFKLDYANVVRVNGSPNNLITGTPIVVRLQQREQSSGLSLQFVTGYWCKRYPVSMFIRQLGNNLLKKYNEYYHQNINIDTVFYRCKLLREVALKVNVNGSYQDTVIASKWVFNIASTDIARFALDCGLGERNSLGFGFMNPIAGGIVR